MKGEGLFFIVSCRISVTSRSEGREDKVNARQGHEESDFSLSAGEISLPRGILKPILLQSMIILHSSILHGYP